MADLALIKSFTEEVLAENNLKGWRVEWGRGVRLIGCANYRKKAVSLSKYWMFAMSEEDAIEIVLHEVAHAIARRQFSGSEYEMMHGPIKPHGSEWRLIAKNLGCRETARTIRRAAGKYEAHTMKQNYIDNCKAKM